LIAGSNTVSWTAPQKPMARGFSVGVTVTVHGPWANAATGANAQARTTPA
jgi:hypothetical protein